MQAGSKAEDDLKFIVKIGRRYVALSKVNYPNFFFNVLNDGLIIVI